MVARNRPCTFYKDGSFDPDQETQEAEPVTSASTSTTSSGHNRDVISSADDPCFLFADTKDSTQTRSRRRGPPLESRTSNILASLGESLCKLTLYDTAAEPGRMFTDAEPFGNFIKWMQEPPLPSRYTGSIEMPSRNVQMQLLEIHFRDFYEALPILPRRYFFQQLNCKGPLITPLLLNAIYALTSRFVNHIPELPKPEVFFHRAKRLLDDFMDVPRISTVVALVYMSIYEPLPSTHRVGSLHCRSWMYSGMAFRMCLELGLHNQSNISKDLQRDEIEMRKRVFWTCFWLDKFQSGGWERPWMIPTRLCKVDFPVALPDDDPEEQLILDALLHKVKFSQICEEALTVAVKAEPEDNNSRGQFYEQCSAWLRSLPPSLQWTPTSTLSIDDVVRSSPPRPLIAQIHTFYNLVALDLLFRMPKTAYNQFQQRIAAACITQLVHFACHQPTSVVRFDALMHAQLAALKVHVKQLYSNDVNLARQSWAMFDRAVLSIHKLREHAVIPNSAKFLQQLGSGGSVEGNELPTEDILQPQFHQNVMMAPPVPLSAAERTTAVPPPLPPQMMYPEAQNEYMVMSMNQGQQQQQQQPWLPVLQPTSSSASTSIIKPMGQPEITFTTTNPTASSSQQHQQEITTTHLYHAHQQVWRYSS